MPIMKLIPFAVTEDDYWVSIPLQGMTPHLIRLAVQANTPYWLKDFAVDSILQTAKREATHPCKTCKKRMPSRNFLVLGPPPEERVRGFIVCETCADQMKQDVAAD